MNTKLLIVSLACCGVVLTGCSQQARQESSEAVEVIGNDLEEGAAEVVDELDENLNANNTVILDPQNNSGQSGTVSLESTEDGNTTVTIKTNGGEVFTTPQPAHIHLGTCDEIGAVQYPLENLVDGASVTILNESMEEILASSDTLAINVHKSVSESNIYTACGNLK